MQLKSINLIILLVSLLLVQGIKAQFLCSLFDKCTSSSPEEPGTSSTNMSSAASTTLVSFAPTTTTTTTTTSSAPAVSSSSSAASSSSSTKAPSSSVQPVTSSSPTPSSKESSRESSSSEPSAETSMSSDTASSTKSSKASGSTSTTASNRDKSTPHNNNVGVIVGSVCGFVAIIGAGFAYAFFSKTRRNNRRNKRRLNSENGDLHDSQSDPFNPRPSPALAASAVTAADGIHNNRKQWEMAEQQSYGYGNTMVSSQSPTAADPYYSSPQMGYAVEAGNYYNEQQAYYDPTSGYQYGYYDQQHGEPYAVQQQQGPAGNTLPPTAIQTTNSNVYQTPHSYPEENRHPSTTNNEGSYR